MEADQPRPPRSTIVRELVAHAAWLVLVVFAGVNVAHVVRRVPVPPLVASAGEPDPLMRMERRLAPLRRALEEKRVRGIVGYVGDAPGRRTLDDAQAVVDYYQAQFALVPVVLDLEVERTEWAVANLRHAQIAERMPADFAIEQDFGGGVLLLRKAAR